MTTTPSNPKTLQARIVSGSVVMLSGSGLTTVLNLAYNVLVARFLGPIGFGQTSAVFTLLTLISAVTLSYQLVAAKAVAQANAQDGAGTGATGLGRSAWATGLVISLLLLIFQGQISAYLKLPSPVLVVLLAAGAAFYVPLGSRRGLVQGAYGFRKLAANLVLEGTVRLFGSLLMVLLGFGVSGVIAANAAAVAVAYAAIVPPALPGGIRRPLGGARREMAQAMVFFSGQMLINNCDIVLVKHFFTPTAAGLYAVVAMVGRVIFALCQAVVNSMVPIVAGTKEEERRGHGLIATALLLVLALGAVLALALRLIPASAWTRLFGPGFLLSGPQGFPFLLALYAIMTVVYSLSAVTITYEMSYKIANTSWVQLLFSGLIIAGICRYHASLEQVILVQLALVLLMLALVAAPFLGSQSRAGSAAARPGPDAVQLERRVSEDEVISEFLKSEFSKGSYSHYHDQFHSLVYAPDFESRDENVKRRALLSVKHLALWKEIPLDTEWYEAALTDADLAQVRVFPRAQWRKVARGNFAITEVADRLRAAQGSRALLGKIESIRGRFTETESKLGTVVLLGLDASGPLVVIDGNHRFVAAVLEGKIDQLRFLCGVSPNMDQCCWYRTNVRTLTRYAKNLVRHVARDPKKELAGLLEATG